MAVPSYTTDLTSGVISTCETNTNFTNIGTGADAQETDYYIQGNACVSKPFNITAGGIYFNFGSGITFTSGQCYFAWYYFGAPNALLAETAGGMQAFIGSSGADYNKWDVFGSDTYTYGGWRCVPIDPINVTADDVTGTPTGTRQYFGVYTNTSTGIGKGNPLGLDVMRYGRGEARVADGSTADGYATFSGLATTNDNTSNRWGLFQAIDGGYLWQGLLILGYTTTVDFRDSNKNILVANTKKVLTDFNTIEVRQSGSRVDWTGIQISALGTNSRGNFTMTDNADVNFDTCTFNDLGTFVFQSNATTISTIFRRCNLVTQGGSVFTSCTFDSTNDSTKALLSDDLSDVSSSSFISSGTKHAIEANTANGATYYLDGSDAAATDPQGVWTNDSEAFNGDTTTQATTTTAGTASTNYLMAEGSNAPGTGSTIIEVRARIYGSVASGDTLKATIYSDTLAESLGTVSLTGTTAGWGNFAALTTPSGGWTWPKVQALETKIYKEGTAGTANAYRVEIAVFTSTVSFSGNTFTGYAVSDGSTGNEAFYNNSSGPIILYISSGDTPSVRNGTGASTVIVSSVDITINVVDTSQVDIQNARVYVTKDSDSSVIINGSLTDANGEVTGSTTSGAGAITIRVRKSSTGTTRYFPVETTATVGGSNITVNVTMTRDTIAAT